jgi:hypothetical protein
MFLLTPTLESYIEHAAVTGTPLGKLVSTPTVVSPKLRFLL